MNGVRADGRCRVGNSPSTDPIRGKILFAMLPKVASLAIVSLCLAVMAGGQEKLAESKLTDFYVVRFAFSDDGPSWFDYILDVKAVPQGTRVREVRIAQADKQCQDPVTVKAVERIIPGSSVASFAGKTDMCGLTEEDVSSAITKFKAKTMAGVFDSARFAVVAHCGSTERVFRFPFPEEVDFAELERGSPEAARIWDLFYQVQREVFGKREIFYQISPDRDAELQRQGATLIPELRSSEFDGGFGGSSLRSLLDHYHGQAADGTRSHVDLLAQDNLRLARYVAPIYPPVARSARIEGKVEVEINSDVKTGEVQSVNVVSGHPLLGPAAVSAAKKWQFEVGQRGPILATLEFSLCSSH